MGYFVVVTSYSDHKEDILNKLKPAGCHKINKIIRKTSPQARVDLPQGNTFKTPAVIILSDHQLSTVLESLSSNYLSVDLASELKPAEDQTSQKTRWGNTVDSRPFPMQQRTLQKGL